MRTVLRCWRYPVKSAAAGCSTFAPVARAARPGCTSRAGRRAAAAPAAVGLLAGWLGRPVSLTTALAPDLSLHRLWPDLPGMVPGWQLAARPGAEAVTAVTGDYGPVHLLTSGALGRLGEELVHFVAPERFRPNLLLELPADPEPGTQLQVGSAQLRVDIPTPRCVVPSLAQPPAPEPDRNLLSVLARRHRRSVRDLGRAAVFGCYARVVRPGRVCAGDPVAVLGRTTGESRP